TRERALAFTCHVHSDRDTGFAPQPGFRSVATTTRRDPRRQAPADARDMGRPRPVSRIGIISIQFRRQGGSGRRPLIVTTSSVLSPRTTPFGLTMFDNPRAAAGDKHGSSPQFGNIGTLDSWLIMINYVWWFGLLPVYDKFDAKLSDSLFASGKVAGLPR